MIKEGALVGGHFQIIKLLGSGGMGTVHQAMDLNLNRPVAIKFVHLGRVHDEETVARFMREARILSSIQHANIIKLFSFSKSQDTFFIVMEMVEGEPLSRLLARQGALNLGEAIDIMEQVLLGLSEAHSHG